MYKEGNLGHDGRMVLEAGYDIGRNRMLRERKRTRDNAMRERRMCVALIVCYAESTDEVGWTSEGGGVGRRERNDEKRRAI